MTHEVFGAYGPVRVASGMVRASLHPTFDFLLAKYGSVVPERLEAEPAAAAFAAGYTDAEGSFGVYGGRSRFKIDSYDAAVLAWFASWCDRIGVRCKHRLVAAAGTPRTDGTVYNGDLWRVNVNDAASLCRLAASLTPFVRHARRRAMMEAAVDNAVARLRANDPPPKHP